MPNQVTAYRQLTTEFSDQDLKRLFTPIAAERTFLGTVAARQVANLALTIHFKAFQYLGYFTQLKDVPERVKVHIGECLGFKRLPKNLEAYDDGPSRRRHFDAVRTHLKVRPLSTDTAKTLLVELAEEAAKTKHDPMGILDQMVEQLLRLRYELPGFTVLERIARSAREHVQDRYLKQVADALSAEGKAMIDALFKRGNDPITGWLSLKREPKKPTNKEVRFWLAHIERLKKLADNMPPLEIPIPKLTYFRNWARAWDVSQMSRLKADTRHALAAILIHAQLGQALDDAVDMYTRYIQAMENNAIARLQKHRLDSGNDVDALIAQLLETTRAAQAKGTAQKRTKLIDESYAQEKDAIIEACQRHLAVRHKDFVPFLPDLYEGKRLLLMNCLEIAEPQSLDDDTQTRALIETLRNLRKTRRSREISLEDVGLERRDLNWLNEMWRRHVFLQKPTDERVLDRVYLELAIHFRLRDELKSGELFVPKADRHENYNERLVDDARLKAELPAYGESTRIEVDPARHVAQLKKTLIEHIQQADDSFPKNPYAEIAAGKLKLKHGKKSEPNEEAKALEEIISTRMQEYPIGQAMVEASRWVNLASEFRTVREERGRLKDLPMRIAVALICYGLNFGATQTARSVKVVSRKQVTWVNHQYVTEQLLDRCITRVVNHFNEYLLPRYWGSGKSASADGTKWSVYEQNLISERHIRYGGFGGIGYYHVSDRYIALMSCFTTCGTYEAIHILDGLLKNESDIQPDTVHGDTQAQNFPVFGLAYLLGIKLMPRMRGFSKLTLSRADARKRCRHIEPLFKDKENKNAIDWALIESQMPEMMRVAVSIKVGEITSADILRRLSTRSRKNKLYFGFRELGRVVRTLFMLEYINDIDLRKTIHAATNKSEQFNGFLKLIFFGGEGIIAENVRHEQLKIVKWAHLAANLIILHNVNQMTRILTELEAEGYPLTEQAVAGVNPFRMGHLDRMGTIVLDGGGELPPSLSRVEFKTEGAVH